MKRLYVNPLTRMSITQRLLKQLTKSAVLGTKGTSRGTSRLCLSFTSSSLSFLRAGAIVLVLGFFVGGCASTNAPASISNLDTSLTQANHQINTMDEACIAQVRAQQAQVSAPSPSQSLALANSALYCVGDIAYSPAHKNTKTAMQFSALAFVSFVTAGDMQKAAETLSEFRQRFPQQDLLFADYTSFVDTATVLVKQNEVTPNQLVSLNINPTLRAEITRQRKWSLR